MPSMFLDQALTILLLVAWSLLTIGLGRRCLTPFSLVFASRAEDLFFSAGIGLTVMAYGVFLLGLAGALSPHPLWLFLATAGLIALTGWRRPFPATSPQPALRPSWDRLAALLLALLLLALLPLVFTPETGKDALIYHLAVPKHYLMHGGFYFVPGNVFAGYPLLAEMHYLLALFLKNDILAQGMHLTLLGATLLGIGLLICRSSRKGAFPALSMLAFASIPSVFTVAHAAYNDLFVAFFTLAALYAFLRWSQEPVLAWIVLSGILVGAAVSCKYTALLLPPLGVLGILWRLRKSHRGLRLLFAALFAFLMATFVTGAPFYLKNWITLGNPFYPFFHEFFGGRGWDADQARLYSLFIFDLGLGREWVDYLLLPWNLSFRAQMDSPRFDGILGPIFLVTLPFLLGKRHWLSPVPMILFFLLATFLFWASTAQQIRYLIPQFALAAVVVGAILARYRKQRYVFSFILLLVGGSLAFNGWHIAGEIAKTRPLAAAWGRESREAFLTRMIPAYPLYRLVNEELPPESRVFLIYMKNFTFLCERDCYSDALFEVHSLQKILRASASPEGVRSRLRKEGFTHLLYDEHLVLGEPSPLSFEEKDIFLTFREGHLEKLAHQGPYRLDRLRKPPENLPLIQ